MPTPRTVPAKYSPKRRDLDHDSPDDRQPDPDSDCQQHHGDIVDLGDRRLGDVSQDDRGVGSVGERDRHDVDPLAPLLARHGRSDVKYA
jgi:hypothetical protein